MPTYRNDPRWITARFVSKCAGCKTAIEKGTEAFYYPASRSVYGKACGCAAPRAADFEAAAFDDMNNGCL